MHLITKIGVQILLSRVSMFLMVLVKKTYLSIKTVFVTLHECVDQLCGVFSW